MGLQSSLIALQNYVCLLNLLFPNLFFLSRKQNEGICLMAKFDVEFPCRCNGLQSSLIAFIFKNITVPWQ